MVISCCAKWQILFYFLQVEDCICSFCPTDTCLKGYSDWTCISNTCVFVSVNLLTFEFSFQRSCFILFWTYKDTQIQKTNDKRKAVLLFQIFDAQVVNFTPIRWKQIYKSIWTKFRLTATETFAMYANIPILLKDSAYTNISII